MTKETNRESNKNTGWQFAVSFFKKVANVLKFQPSLNTIQHDTDHVTIKTIGTDKDIIIDANYDVLQKINGVIKFGVFKIYGNQTYQDFLCGNDGALDLGSTTRKFKLAVLKDTIYIGASALTDTVSDGNGQHQFTLPNTLENANYIINIVLQNGNRNDAIVAYKEITKSTTAFTIELMDSEGAAVDCSSGSPQDVGYSVTGVI